MCGLSGVFSFDTFDEAKLKHSISRISHRGPDAIGTYISKDHRLALAHARLSILDTSTAANQPMSSGHAVIAFNGEIYNHLELRKNIQTEWVTSSDTETILKGYLSCGKSIFAKLDGMFAGAIYDELSNELIIFRDRLGVKNLYFCLEKKSISFSSEIKSLLALINNKPDVDLGIVQAYLKFENFPQGESFFKGIKNLLPGEIKIINLNNRLEIRTDFIELSSETNQQSGNLVETGRLIIEKSVKSHLLSDVPVGVYLSGGIDSSLVASIAAKKIKNIEGFTGYFETKDSFYDERKNARLVADNAGIKLHEVKITPQDFLDNFDTLIWHLDEPRMGMGAFSQFMVAKKAAKSHKVILAGHGGDELFSGYFMFKAFWIYTNSGFNSTFFKALRQVKPKEWIWIFFLLFKRLIEKKFYFAPQIFNSSYDDSQNTFTTSDKRKLMDNLNHYYKNVYIPGLLVVEDKISMAHSLETRVPLWSSELLQWASSLPIEIKLAGGELKHLLRDIAKTYLPRELFLSEKKGFPTPLRFWFRQELKDFIRQRLCQPNKFLDQIISKEKRISLVERHISKELPYAFDEKRAHQIWMLLCLESWSRQFEI
jgi:asparagine synthase (glutamine-hydrolysing)